MKILSRLREAGVTLNKDKCQFYTERISILGHIVDNKGN